MDFKLNKDFLEKHCDSTQIKSKDYRPDIDGLRALAVLSVLLFHAFPNFLPGGFIGVDIFFVISGYLISKHIFASLNSEFFSYKYFYTRRIKRIFPALILVLISSVLLGWIMLSPGEYKSLGRHVAASAGFVSNLIFWRESGYFDSAADTKPLLHLWSLAIEEQFYIFWPLIITFLWRYLKNRLTSIIFLLCITSLIYSIFLVEHNPVADFYSPLTRFWELAIGSIIALKPNFLNNQKDSKSLLSLLGFALIIYAVIFLDKNKLFPGYIALIPTIGASFLILAGSGIYTGWVNNNILSRKPIVYIGLISYPLYLWHWPLLSFTRIAESSSPSINLTIAMLIISFLLAWLTYQFIELPIRSKASYIPRKITLYLVITIIIICFAGLGIKHYQGFRFRTLSKYDGDPSSIILGEDRNLLKKECLITSKLENSKLKLCYTSNHGGKARYVVMGDSKSEALFYGIAREINFADGILIGSVRPPEILKDNERAEDLNQIAFDAVLNDKDLKIVFYSVALRSTFPIDKNSGFISEPNSGEFKKKFDDWLSRYTQAIKILEKTGKKVIFVIDNPTLTDPRDCISGGMTSNETLNILFRRKENPKCSIKYSDYLAGTLAYRKLIDELVRINPGLIIYDPSPLLCDKLNNLCSIKSKDGKFFYSYSDHISDYANSKIANDLKPTMMFLLKGQK